LRESILVAKTSPKKAIMGQNSLYIEDETGKKIGYKLLANMFLDSNDKKTLYYLNELIDGLKSVSEKMLPKRKAKKMPTIEQLVEQCPIEKQESANLGYWVRTGKNPT
jgi:hypothetical protein